MRLHVVLTRLLLAFDAGRAVGTGKPVRLRRKRLLQKEEENT